ncbi:MAG: pilus assembly protein [Rhodocyclales bacterium]|nr:pilus assembly protein [Rhodocyclales bacterium]
MAKSIKRNGFQLSALAAALCLSATGADAAGLGRITVLSPLGQPLRAEIEVNASREELVSMNARLASPEAFRQVGIEYVQGIGNIRFSVDKRKDGQPYLRMTSDRPINEPFLDVLVELTWASGRMVREYTVLLDPPESLTPATPVAVAAPTATKPAPVQKPVAAPAAAPVVEPAPAPAAAPAPAPVAEQAAPAPTPAPAPAAEPVAARGGEEAASRLVKSGDTLTRIAVETKPEGISLDQMLVALLKSNEGAFDAGNMNRLRAGKILNIPTAEAAAAVAPAEARQVVVTQARDFNAYRSKLAAAVAATPAKEEAAKQQDQGKIAPKVADKPAVAEAAKDKLEVSRTEAARNAKALQGRITALEEDLLARERALKEANSRVADLERNLADLKKLAELKSQAGAQMQKQAETAKPAVEAKPVPPEPKVAKPAEPAPVAPPVEPAKLEEPPKPAEAPAAPPVAEAPKPAEAPVEKKRPVPVVEAEPVEPSFIDDNPALVYGGGGLLALLLGYLGFSAFRRKSRGGDAAPTASRLSEGDLMANSVFGTTGGQAVDTSASIQTDFSQASLSAIDTDEGVDPVAEADVYMAYGRDAQAEEILVDALKTDPSRLAIYLKLLEIYSGHKNLGKFEKVATDLRGQTGGTGPDWDKAAAMGRAIDPGNSLYAGAGMSADQQAEPVVPDVETPVAGFAAAPQRMENTVTLPGQLSQMAESAKPTAPPVPSNLGFDLDLGAPAAAALAFGGKGATGSSAGLDLDVGAPAGASVLDTLDVDLSLPDVAAQPQGGASPKSAGSSGLDFEFDLDAPAAGSGAGALKEPTVDFSGINLDLVTAPASSAAAAAEPAAADGDNADVTTKLELAQAYEEMGDREGARELLEEVVQEGSAHQQDLARAKLASLHA